MLSKIVCIGSYDVPSGGKMSTGKVSQMVDDRAGGGGLLRVAAELEFYYAQHFAFRGGFASPDFELACALLHEHLKAADDGEAARLGELEEWGFYRCIDQIENQRCVELVFFDGELLLEAGHATGRGVDDGVKAAFGEGGLL